MFNVMIVGVCVLALDIQHANHIISAPIILLSVVSPAVPYFSTLSHKRKDFRKKKLIKLKVRVLVFSTIFA